MTERDKNSQRIFKTAWFSKTAKKAGILDSELCKAIHQVMKGQAIDLGGGVFKKRLHNNEHRSIILAKGGNKWIYTFLFAKKDRNNISTDELLLFKKLASEYKKQTDLVFDREIQHGNLFKICNETKI